jgi:hypothetical protein
LFRIHEPGRDPGFGQSILHEGQLVFRTPPYGSVQEAGSSVGNPKATGADGVKVRMSALMHEAVFRTNNHQKEGVTCQEIYGMMMK